MRKYLFPALALLLSAGMVSAQFQEAPVLARAAAAGEIPPLAERLPPEPLVVPMGPPDFQIGQYKDGSAIETNFMGQGFWWPAVQFAIEGIVRADTESTIHPNLARSWEWNEDKSSLTLHFVKGIKWSDGQAEFTTEDLRFTYEDVVMNTDLTPTPNGKYLVNGQPWQMHVIDDHTLRLDFGAPNPLALLFLSQLAQIGHQGGDSIYLPAHHYKQFHLDYNEDADSVAKSNGSSDWKEHFSKQRQRYWLGQHYPEVPTVAAWMPVSASPQLVRWERNPYYWKVDEEGKQLPYIDAMNAEFMTNGGETWRARDIAGELFVGGWYPFTERPQFGDIARVGLEQRNIPRNLGGTEMVIHLNLTVDDPVKRAIFQDTRFRRALSKGINRQPILAIVFGPQGVAGMGYLHALPWRDAEVEAAEADVLAYDADEANRLLDEMGLTERDSDGFRLMPDGRRLTINFTMDTIVENQWRSSDQTQIIAQQWKDIGVELNFNLVERSLLTEMAAGNEHEGTMWAMTIPYLQYLLSPQQFIQLSWWAPLWDQWYTTQGAGGEEPPPEFKEYLDLAIGWAAETDEEKAQQMARDANIMAYEKALWLGVGAGAQQFTFVRDTLVNMPLGHFQPDSWVAWKYLPEGWWLE